MPNYKSSIVRILKDGVNNDLKDGVNNDPVGAGFLITPHHVVTCAHVVNQALGRKQDAIECPHRPVFLDFPLLKGHPAAHAQVLWWVPLSENVKNDELEDIAILELPDNFSTDEKIQAVQLVHCEERAAVTMIGFPDMHLDGNWASGELRGLVGSGWIEINSKEVAPGFSGTAVWSPSKELVYGMIVCKFEDKLSYMMPTASLRKACEKIGSKQPMTNGTNFASIAFEGIIRKKIGELFEKNQFEKVGEEILCSVKKEEKFCNIVDRLSSSAKQDEKELKIALFLCSNEIKVEDAIGLLTDAARNVLNNMPKGKGKVLEQRNEFKKISKEILGWLVLRSVDSACAERIGVMLRKEEHARATVRVSKATGVEVVVARSMERASEFYGDSRKLAGHLAVTSLKTDGGIEAPDTIDALEALIWNKIMKVPPLNGPLTKENLEKLHWRIAARSKSRDFDYLAIPVDGPDARISLEEIEEFHRSVSYLKLVLIQCESDGMSNEPKALVVRDGLLHEQLLHFFEEVIEEKNKP